MIWVKELFIGAMAYAVCERMNESPPIVINLVRRLADEQMRDREPTADDFIIIVSRACIALEK